MKTCSKCQIEKPLEDFNRHPQTRDGRQSQCRSCACAAARASSKKKYADPCPVSYALRAKTKREEAYRRKYGGFTISDYDRQLEAQNGGCAICGTTDPGWRDGRFHIDHCHETGKVRGLLCFSHNTGLGKFGDDPVLLARAIDYLLDPPAVI